MVIGKKNKKEFEILAFLILILVINSAFQINIYKYFSKNSPLHKDFSESLKSAYYNPGPIYVEDDNPARDWAYHASHYPWCTGSGAENDPYIINNVYIDAGGVGHCIRIIDSEAYFIIQNCLLENSGPNFDDGGILLEHANNGRIQNNTISSHGQSGIYLRWPSDNTTIHNNTFANNDNGIFFDGDNAIITNNIFSNNGLYFVGVDNGKISNNLIDNGQEGITIYDCTRFNITDNIVRNTEDSGITVVGSGGYHIVSNNILTNNDYGIFHGTCADNIFYNNTATSNNFGMKIGGARNQVLNNSLSNNTEGLIVYGESHYVAYNNVSLNTNRGIQLYSSNSKYYKNIFNENIQGIDLIGNGNNLTGNMVNYNTQTAMRMRNSDGNFIYQNSFSHNTHYGINMEGDSGICENNKIIQNEIDDNWFSGINLDDCEYNEIYGNSITSCHNTGLLLWENCNWNDISNNYIYDNFQRGIWLYQYNDYNFFENNTIYSNRNLGIRMGYDINYNNFTENIIENNVNIGITIEHPAVRYNLFYKNYFIDNLVHVSDVNAAENDWNSSTIGNYWDDNLINVDSNDDGIGEYPYNITLSPFLVQDFLPIFEDGDEPAPPIVSILTPKNNQVTGINSPNYEISIIGLYVHTKWYELIGGSKNITVTENLGDIDQILWDEFGNGTVTIRFYVNDSLGYGTFGEITFRKDINQPQIVINTPVSDNLYDSIAPIFNVEISDPNLDTSWYSLDGGLTNIIFATNSSINQTIWDTIPDGQVEIQFYVNDTAGNLIFDSVSVRKDTHTPVITITSPNSYDLFGNSTISFNVEIFDLNLEKMWYTIVGSLTNITFISNGTIDTALWNSFGSGDLTLVFYANDTHGRISTNNVIVSKDIDPPSISIISPTLGETFYVTPPEFEITVSDTHLELVWYTIDGGITNVTITQYTDFISQSVWGAAPQGDITLRFYARDSLGNIKFAEITIKKSSVTQQQPPQEIPGYDLYIMVSVIMIMFVLFVFKKKK